MYQVEGYQYILKVSCRPLDFTSYKAFLKPKRSFKEFKGVSSSSSSLGKVFLSLVVRILDTNRSKWRRGLSWRFVLKSHNLVFFYLSVNQTFKLRSSHWELCRAITHRGFDYELISALFWKQLMMFILHHMEVIYHMKPSVVLYESELEESSFKKQFFLTSYFIFSMDYYGDY